MREKYIIVVWKKSKAHSKWFRDDLIGAMEEQVFYVNEVNI